MRQPLYYFLPAAFFSIIPLNNKFLFELEYYYELVVYCC
ncbi:hypothetical protein FHS68_001108 [Dyadobacter arcticus]|uniref:Uncharacterized protein n=1 Tax=Dyadobacter arcticus TaxID=1078754 RepID=A0ABX0UGU5_9BACT|nr:hypothetical protein [Dyadobacter arcticus]